MSFLKLTTILFGLILSAFNQVYACNGDGSAAELNAACDAYINKINHGVVSKGYLCSIGYDFCGPTSDHELVHWCQVDTSHYFNGVLLDCPSEPPSAPHSDTFRAGDPSNNVCGSVINVTRRTVGESIPIVGSDIYLNYSSDRVLGRIADRSVRIPLVGASIASTLTKVYVKVEIAGRTFNYQFSNLTPNQYMGFQWDGFDAGFGLIDGFAEAKISVTEENSPAHTYEVPTVYFAQLGAMNNSKYGLGAWNLNVHHDYDMTSQTLYRGDGISYFAPSKLYGTGFYVVANDASEVYYFDENGRHILTNTGLRNAVRYSFSYNSSGQLSSIADSFNNTLTVGRTGGLPTSITSPYGQTTALTTDSNGRLRFVTNPNLEAYELTHHLGGLLATFRKPGGAISTFTYDSLGRLQSDVHSAGSSVNIAQTPVVDGNTFTAASAEGRVIQFTQVRYPYYYDLYIDDGNPSETQISVGYSQGVLAGFTTYGNDGHINVADFFHEPQFGHLSRYAGVITDYRLATPPAHTTVTKTATLADPGDPFSFSDHTVTAVINGKTWTRYFNTANSNFTITSPVNRETVIGVDAFERPTSVKYANYSPHQIYYDNRGRIKEVRQTTARRHLYAYNSAGYLSTITNPLLQVKSFTYDSAGRVATETLPDLRVIGYNYDANGNLTSVTPPGKPAYNLEYNDFDLLAGHLTSNPTTYTYNDDRQLTQIDRPAGQTIQFHYNNLNGRLTSITAPGGNYTFTQAPQWKVLDAVTSPDGITHDVTMDGDLLLGYTQSGSATSGLVNLTYNDDKRLASTQINTAAVVSYIYDNDGLLKNAGNQSFTINASTGKVTRRTLSSATENYTYSSNFGEVASIIGKYGSTNLYSTSFTRDNLARLATNAEQYGSGSVNNYGYTYDDAGRLTHVSLNGSAFHEYVYDTNSNRLQYIRNGVTTTATYNTRDQILTYGTKSYTHNNNGELTLVSDSSTTPAATTSYTYNAFGNLKSADLPGTPIISYMFDGFNRRVARYVGNNLNKQFLYFDSLKIAAELNGAGALVSQFIYGNHPNVPDYMIKGGARYQIVKNHLGSVVAVVHSTNGTVAQEIKYDELGRVLSDTNPGFQPFGFAGGLYDPDTKLVRFGAREYDGETGRWLQKDPILFAGGDTNLYGYVLNDPVNFVDPSGYITTGQCMILGAIGGGILGLGISNPIGGGLLGAGVGFVLCPQPSPDDIPSTKDLRPEKIYLEKPKPPGDEHAKENEC